MNKKLLRIPSFTAGISLFFQIGFALLVCSLLVGPVVSGQSSTTVNLSTQGRNPDFSLMPVTRPVSVGTSLPATCIVGQLYFNSAATAGSNLSACTSSNVWSPIGPGLTLPLSVANGGNGTATPGLTAGSNITITGSWPNQTISAAAAPIVVGTSLPAACTVGQLFFNSSAPAGSNLYGCTSTNTWTVVGGASLTSPLPIANGGTGTATPSLISGSNISVTGNWPNQTINTTGATVSLGSTLPAACSLGQLFFDSASAAGSNLYGCTAANTWTVIGGASFTSPLPIANGGTGTTTPSLVAGTNITVTGSWPNQTISASGSAGNAISIQGANVSTTTPSNNQTLVYYGASSSYIPTSIYTLQNGLGTSAVGTTNLQVNVSMGVRSVTTTTDTIVSTDCGGLITYNNSAAVAVALPQPALGGNFLAGCPITVRNYGAGAVTLTPSASSIGGNSSQAVNQNKGCLLVSDGSNWQLGNCN